VTPSTSPVPETTAATHSPGPPTASISATPPLDYSVYVDPSGVRVPYPRDNTLTEGAVEIPGKGTLEGVTSRTVVFRDPFGSVTLSLSFTPNPNHLSLRRWVEVVPGWPGDVTDVTVDWQPALRFRVDQTGAANPTVYVSQDGIVMGIRGNVSGGEGSAGTLAITEFDQIISGITWEE
jgi:hypothetical protein